MNIVTLSSEHLTEAKLQRIKKNLKKLFSERTPIFGISPENAIEVLKFNDGVLVIISSDETDEAQAESMEKELIASYPATKFAVLNIGTEDRVDIQTINLGAK